MTQEMLTTSGTIHLPKWVCEQLQLKPGDRVEFRRTRDGRIIMDKAGSVLSRPVGSSSQGGGVGGVKMLVGFED